MRSSALVKDSSAANLVTGLDVLILPAMSIYNSAADSSCGNGSGAQRHGVGMLAKRLAPLTHAAQPD